MKMPFKGSTGFTVLSMVVACLLFCFQAGCVSRPRHAQQLQGLQGRWEGVLVGQEKDGKIVITIAGDSLHFYRDTNFWFMTRFTLPAGTNPQQLRATITDSKDKESNGKVVPAILKTGDGKLTLAINQDTSQEPPKSFDVETRDVMRWEFRRIEK